MLQCDMVRKYSRSLPDTPRRRNNREAQRRRRANPEIRELENARGRERYRNNPEKEREVAREAWAKRLERAAGRPRPEACEICGGPPSGRGRMHFDHAHGCCREGCATCFRGWICTLCNCGLGYARDNPDILRAWIAYLERFTS